MSPFTPYALALRFLNTKEVVGPRSNAIVLAMLQLDNAAISDDAVPWCSAFVNFIAWLCGLPRSRSLAARSWLAVGTPIPLAEASVGFDVVVLQRGVGPQPGPDVLAAPGHVGFYAGVDGDHVLVLGGNQGGDMVSVAPFPVAHVLGVRRLAEA